MKRVQSIKLMTMMILVIFGCSVVTVTAKSKNNVIEVKYGSLDLLLQEKKKATFEIDYSQLIITDSKNHDNDMDFLTWMQTQDEDDDEWTKDWEEKDKANCDKAFRDEFNSEIEDVIKLSKFGKDYHLILKLTMLDFGPPVKYSWKGLWGGEAVASGELELKDQQTGETILLISFENLKGESSFKQIGRLKGIFENLCEKLNDLLKKHKKEQKKAKKK